LLIVAGLVIVAAIVYAFLPKPMAVDLATVRRGPLMLTVDEDGRTRIKDRYVVSAPLAGRLRRIELRAGDPVEAGRTLIAVIDPADPALLDTRARAEAEARVSAAEATKEQAVRRLEVARSNSDFAAVELKRARQLAASGVLARRDLDDAESKQRSAVGEQKAAESAVQVATFELDQAKAALSETEAGSTRPLDASGFEIRSPIDGRVLRVTQESTTVVSAGTSLVEVGDPHALEVEVDLLSADAVKISAGAKAILDHWGGPGPLTGRVRRIEPAAFTKVSALGVEEQRVWVIIEFVDPPEKRRALGDGFRVEARVVVWEADNVLKVPSGALFRHGGQWAVFLGDDDRARLRTITLGHDNGLEAEVLTGLEPNQQVIVHPGDVIADGVAVEARKKQVK
jgi:HlyD family secretion protein